MMIYPKYPYDITQIDVNKTKAMIADGLRIDHSIVKAFHSGDHWQGGAGWVGPMPGTGEAEYQYVSDEIKSAFTSQNVIAEVVERHMMGIMGREPNWSFTERKALSSTEASKRSSAIDEVEAGLTEWWDERGVHTKLQHLVTTALWAEHAVIRLYVPRGYLRDAMRGDGTRVKVLKPVSTIAEAMKLIHVAIHDPDQARVYTDEDYQQPLGAFAYQDDEKKDHYELTWVDEQGFTVISTDGQSFALDFGQRIPMHQLELKSLITDQVMQNQRAMNLALSMVPRNVVTGGFLERVLLNAQMPGEWEYDAEGNRTKFIPSQYHTGSGTTNFVVGVDVPDADGNTKLSTPDIRWRPPTEVGPSVEAKDAHKLAILDECDQAHVLTNSSQYQTGKSKEQARADFMARLNLTRVEVDRAGRWLMETVLAMAEQFLGTPGQYSKTLRAVFNAKPDYGPLSSEERKSFSEAMEKGVISRERNMYLQGVDDIDAEIAKINEERLGKLDMIKRQLEIIELAGRAGLSMEVAAKLAEMTEEQVKLLAQSAEKVAEDAKEEQREIAAATKAAGGADPEAE